MSNENKKYDLLFKVIMIGDAGVGKTQLINKYANDKFDLNYSTTIGVEFFNHNLIIDGKSVAIQIWDSAGEEKYKSLTRFYYQGAAGVFLVYDITKIKTFERIQTQWLAELSNNSMANIVAILIGNKCDLNDKREVTIEQATSFAEENSNMKTLS